MLGLEQNTTKEEIINILRPIKMLCNLFPRERTEDSINKLFTFVHEMKEIVENPQSSI